MLEYEERREIQKMINCGNKFLKLDLKYRIIQHLISASFKSVSTSSYDIVHDFWEIDEADEAYHLLRELVQDGILVEKPDNIFVLANMKELLEDGIE